MLRIENLCQARNLRLLLTALSLTLASHAFAAPAAAPKNARTIKNLPDFPSAVLKRNISPKFFKSLAISPVTAWVVAQAPVTPGGSPKLIRSDAEGAFDKIALEFAKDYSAFHYSTIESRLQRPVLHVHLLVYKIADGLMAVNFAVNDNAAFADHLQSTSVWAGVWKDGKWTTILNSKPKHRYPEPQG